MQTSNRLWVALSALVILTMIFSAVAYQGQAAQDNAPVRLKYATFYPAQGEKPEIPPGLAMSQAAALEKGYAYYIVQFTGPVQEAWKQEVTQKGGELLEYIPDFAFKVRMHPGAAQQVERQPNVAYVGFFEPAYKLSPELKREEKGLYAIRVEGGADLAAVASELATAGVEVISMEGRTIQVASAPQQLVNAANVTDVAWIDNFHLFEKHNEYGGSTIGAATANANGYDGSTQIVGVADTGLGGGAAASAHADIPASRVVAIYNWRGVDDSCWTISDDGPADVNSGHGTHTAVSAVGDGGAAGEGRGAAPGARLVFQSTENWATMIGTCAQYYPSDYYLTGLPTDLRTLFQQAYDAGARIHSNSWGAAVSGDYTSDSAYVDDFVWNHRDMLITFSAGNEGIDYNSDGVIDNGSIGSPATAKNVLAVGASENNRQGNWSCDPALGYTNCAAQGGQNTLYTWGAGWPSDYPANPIKDDLSTGNAQQMAAFSSRGPVYDGRIKPDVVAPGTWVLSGYSDLYQQGYDGSPNPKDSAWQYDGYGYPYSQAYKYMSGTSMSNPLAAGGAAVVRDFYQKAYGVQASGALVKASLINSAVDLLDENNDGVNNNDFPIPNNHEGWGLVNLAGATDGTAQFADNNTGIGTAGSVAYQYAVSAAGAPFKVTLVWSDFPSSEYAVNNLVNDLDLVVTSPSGAVYRGNVFAGGWTQTGGSADRKNNVENVFVQSAETGTWTVQVSGYNVPNGPQPFALVADGSLGDALPTPTPAPTATPTLVPTPTTAPTATPLPTMTGFLSASANSPVTKSAGDNNGFETTPANAYMSDNLYAADMNSGTSTTLACNNTKKDRHIFYNFNISLPASAAVQGIEVRMEGKADSAANSPSFCVELSWDGGTTWTVAKTTPLLGTADAVYTLGSATDTWNRTWLASELGNTKLRLRITPVSSSTSRDFYIDWLAVNVTYRP